MGVKRMYSIPVLLALCHVFYEVTALQCTEQKDGKSIFGMMLQHHIFKRITGATMGNVCLRECYLDVRCQSFNFVISQDMCELNNRTKEARPEDFVADSERYYFTRDWKRVMLGSISELPAETCKEIKASQGGQAVSGKYWFDSIIPGETVLAHCDMEKEAKDCAEHYKSGNQNSGVYQIKPDGLGAFAVYCDQTTGGGWTVFQKRMDGSVDFYRGWADYRGGFGTLNGEFWLGLDKIHRLTSSGGYKLRVDLEDFAGNTVYAEYGLFEVGSEETKYKLSIGNYSGTAGDSLDYHNGQPFSTNDNDARGCAVYWKGAWWYNSCHDSNLNGIYHQGNYTGGDGIMWFHWKRDSAKGTEMKIRAVNY